MIGVLATQIQDYLNSYEYLWDEPKKKAARTRAETARAYIFDDTWYSDNYVFGFKFISRYIGLDPEKFRAAIRQLKTLTRHDKRFNVKSIVGD